MARIEHPDDPFFTVAEKGISLRLYDSWMHSQSVSFAQETIQVRSFVRSRCAILSRHDSLGCPSKISLFGCQNIGSMSVVGPRSLDLACLLSIFIQS